MFCKFCRNPVYDDAIVCPHCGRQIAELRMPAGCVINICESTINFGLKAKEDADGAKELAEFLGGQMVLDKLIEELSGQKKKG